MDHKHLAPSINDSGESDTDSESDILGCAPPEILLCVAKTKKGQPCKGGRLPGSDFCFDHAPLMKGISCSALTRKGKPCRGLRLPGSEFCVIHATQQFGKDVEVERILEGMTDRKANVADHSNVFVKGVPVESENKGETKVENDESSVTESFATANEPNLASEQEAAEPDEMDIEDEADNLQHLRDIFEVESGSESDDSGSTSDISEKSDSSSGIALGDMGGKAHKPEEWDWEMTLEQRWEEAQALMENLRSLMLEADVCIKRAVPVARRELKEAKTCAKARVYENKSVIGGTMVGCISRLGSIRKTRPFAVVVEEASEVLEPLLFACLSESTKKLEMIGDHRQLQPSVMSRYDFEICNNVNISMFQRLIEAPTGHSVSSTVLSVQVRFFCECGLLSCLTLTPSSASNAKKHLRPDTRLLCGCHGDRRSCDLLNEKDWRPSAAFKCVDHLNGEDCWPRGTWGKSSHISLDSHGCARQSPSRSVTDEYPRGWHGLRVCELPCLVWSTSVVYCDIDSVQRSADGN